MRNLCFFCVFAAVSLVAFGVSAQTYKSPYILTATKDGSQVYVLNHDSSEIMVLDTTKDEIVKTFPVGKNPNTMVLSPDEKTLYIGVGFYGGKIQALNLATGKIEKEADAKHTPCGFSIAPDGKTLYVCNRFNNDVSFYALPELNKTQTIAAIREPRSSVVTPDGKTLFVVNFLPNDPADSFDVASEVTAIDTATGKAENIRLPNGSSSLHGICVSPDGKYVYLTEILARYQMPTTQIERGWMNTNGISIIDAESKKFINTVLIDDIDLGASNPWSITTSGDGKQIYVTVSGTHELCVIDTEAMLGKLRKLAEATPNEAVMGLSTNAEVQNDLAFLVGMKKRIKLPEAQGPRGFAVVPTGGGAEKIYIGMYYTDVVKKVDFTTPIPKVTTIELGPKQEMTAIRKGEMYWNDATLCFQAWQTCASCHPDARMDALNWDLMNDGIGNPKNAKSLLYSHLTPPAMWSGVRKTSYVAVRTGFQHILFSVPNEKFCTDVDRYLEDLKPLPSPYLVNGELSEKAKKGKVLFESQRLNCTECHFGDYYTDMKMHDVGTEAEADRRSTFDTPSLNECWRTAPYLHDGRYVTMREVFSIGKHGDVSGDVDTLTDEEIDELCEYVLSL